MKIPRIMIAAPKSGSGKTIVTCALLELLKEQGKEVSAFKCGPDYIDPMFHREIIGVPSRNLDCFFSEDDQIRELFAAGQTEREIAVIEGVMGLYDGLGGIEETASSYHLACVLESPILLVVDAKGMGRSILPLIAGFLAYDRERLIKGVILNKVGPAFCGKIAPVILGELKVPVLGCLPEQKEAVVWSRHLGLMLPAEVDALQGRVRGAAGSLAQNVDVEQLLAMADQAPELLIEAGQAKETAQRLTKDVAAEDSEKKGCEEQVRIAVARDEAFCFYYEENLRLLREAGAELVEFSPLHDEALPERVDGILLGGGYPELYARRLAENESMRASIKCAIEGGMPSVAECGGFLYLHRTLVDQNGEHFPMCGVLPETCEYTGRLVRFGYITLQMAGGDMEGSGFFLQDQKIRAHEFHYYDSSDNGNACHAVKPVSGQSWYCIYAGPHHWWGFPHLYYPSNPTFATNYIAAVAAYKNCQLKKNVR